MTWNFLEVMDLAMKDRSRIGGPAKPSLIHCLRTWTELKEKAPDIYRTYKMCSG